jgi:hypothetical protein
MKPRFLKSPRLPPDERLIDVSCHSERSEESLIHSGAKRRTLPNQSQRSFAFAQDDKPLSGLDQTAFSKITEIATR